MRPFLMTALLLALVGTMSAEAGATKLKGKKSTSSATHHLLRKGETAASVAEKYDLSLAELMGFNPGLNLDEVLPGQRLRVGGLSTSDQQVSVRVSDSVPVVSPLGNRIVVLKGGETLNSLSELLGVEDRDLQSLNPGINFRKLRAGQRILVPSPESPTQPKVLSAHVRLPLAPLPLTPKIERSAPLPHLERMLPTPPRLQIAYADLEPRRDSQRLVDPHSQETLIAKLAPVPPSESNQMLDPNDFEVADPRNLDLFWPVETRTISSNWGLRARTKTVRVKGKRKANLRYQQHHKGLDLNAPKGTDVYAALDGKVVLAGRSGKYGNTVILDHGNGVVTLYAHNTSNVVREGMVVRKGQKIAEVGATGNASGPHCHFELRVNGVHKNPLPMLSDEEEVSVDMVAKLDGSERPVVR